MSKFIKFVLLAIPIFCLGIVSSYISHSAPVQFAVSGKVELIEWQSKNHGIPRIEIRLKNGELKRFSSARIILKPEDLQVGDSFEKASNSMFCQINNKEVKCLE